MKKMSQMPKSIVITKRVSAEADSFRVGMIRGKKIPFTPGPALKKVLADLVFDKQPSYRTV